MARGIWHVLLVTAVTSLFALPASATTKPLFNDWFALGSGCRAKSDLPGNVQMEALPADPTRPSTHRVKFTFKDFQLKGDTAERAVMQFARECAVRLNINPPEGKRIVDIRAQTSVVASKETGATLDVLSELKLGNASLGIVRRQLDASARIRPEQDAIDLAAGSSGEALPHLGCGEHKIIGFDYSWIAKREQKQISRLSVELGGDKSLVIEATLGDCKA